MTFYISTLGYLANRKYQPLPVSLERQLAVAVLQPEWLEPVRPLSVLELIHLTQGVTEDGVLTVELEVPTELLLLKQEWEPVAVVRPHVGKGDLVQLELLRAHFFTLCGRPVHVVSREDMHVHQLGGAHKLK